MQFTCNQSNSKPCLTTRKSWFRWPNWTSISCAWAELAKSTYLSHFSRTSVSYNYKKKLGRTVQSANIWQISNMHRDALGAGVWISSFQIKATNQMSSKSSGSWAKKRSKTSTWPVSDRKTFYRFLAHKALIQMSFVHMVHGGGAGVSHTQLFKISSLPQTKNYVNLFFWHQLYYLLDKNAT